MRFVISLKSVRGVCSIQRAFKDQIVLACKRLPNFCVITGSIPFRYKSVGVAKMFTTESVCGTKSNANLIDGEASLVAVMKDSSEGPSLKTDNEEHSSKDPPLSRRAQKRKIRAQKYKEIQRKRKAQKLQAVQKEDTGYNIEDFEQSEYYFENGLRKVYPYPYVFGTYAKGRWVKRRLQEILEKEFGFDHPDQLKQAFDEGRIFVDHKKVSIDHVVSDCEYISHRIHRHENPVTAAPFEVIEDTDKVLVVNKPSSIPCHPCGRYRFNSVVFILGKELGYTNLANIYRLDRLTSGVLMLGKCPEYTRVLEDQVAKRNVEKEYVCRVVGEFPEGPITVNQPLEALSNKLRLQIVAPSGKASTTVFQRLSYNGTSSVVKCFPKTGRTHQIRVHLQYLGHPIINDTFYNSEAWGPNKGKSADYGVPHDQVCERIMSEHFANFWDGGDNPVYQERFADSEEKTEKVTSGVKSSEDTNKTMKKDHTLNNSCLTNKESSDCGQQVSCDSLRTESNTAEGPGDICTVQGKDKIIGQPGFDISKLMMEKGCQYCKRKSIDPSSKDLVMFLHALKYKGPDWQYEAPLPDWADPDWHKEEEFML